MLFAGRKDITGMRWLTKTSVSNNVGGVKHFASVVIPALRGARHFALGFRRSELVGLESDEIQMPGALGGGGANRQGWPHPYCPHSRMRQSSTRSVEGGSRGHGGTDLSSRRQSGEGVGKRHLTECRMVRSQDLLRESRLGAYCTARFAQNLCEAVPQ